MFLTGKITPEQFQKYKENRLNLITQEYVDGLKEVDLKERPKK